MPRTSRTVIGLAAALLTSSAGVFASPPTQEVVQAWMNTSWENAKAFPTDRAYRLDLKVEQHDVPPPEVMTRLRKEIPGHPDHPEKTNLPIYEARLAGKYDWVEVTYWSDPTSGIRRHNRTNRDFAGTMIEYSDTGIGKEVMWGLFTDKQLVIVSPSRPDPMYDFPVLLGGQINVLNWTFSTGLSSGYACKIPVPKVTVDGYNWTATSGDKKRRMTFEATGTWDAEHGTGLIQQVKVSGNDPAYSQPFAIKYVASGHHYLAAVDRWVPGRIEHWKAESGPLLLYAIYSGLDASVIEPSEVKDMATLPTMGGTDPTRGTLAFASTLDLRSNERAYKNRNAEGGIDVIPLAETPLFKHQSRLTRFGWVSASLVIVALVALRFRKWNTQRNSEGSSHA